ncbi:sodium/nucleoside cotransporter [Purpureocillium lavendulum]|uniref:Protein HRI1 n=1 Tax=Purpureocillium lavendulum TaxID=1247861 RepID=A0AB34FN88_9HYPO|nr:sodium/nucleoside cotransporter [Purpureocillium lavendulum]
MASISIRKSIRWLPDEAGEPTSTVVLTSPARRFVDLRILKPDAGAAPDGNGPDARLPLSRLDWAIAGTSSSSTTMRDDGAGGQVEVTHGRWTHWVDSTTRDAGGVVDEGDMVAREDGTVLETGRMVNPATGLVTPYEEVWEDEEPVAPPLTTTPRGRGAAALLCVVLEVDEGGDDRQGRVVRLGGWCQGFVRRGDDIALERWRWADGRWQRMVRMGDLDLACAVAVEERDFEVGQVLDGWKVVEVVHGG